jgi:carboxymethylenebutenolidase
MIDATTSWVDLGRVTRAFLATPARSRGPNGAVILGHERSGLVQSTLDLAARFASYGYVCLAPDMASHWDGDRAALGRGEVSLTLTDEQVQDYMARGMDFLTHLPEVDPARIAAMGVAQSGDYPHLLNSVRPSLTASIVFYGGTQPRDDVVEALTAPTLGIFAEDDPAHPVSEAHALRAKLEAHRKSYEIHLFPGAAHGWLNDSTPGRSQEVEQAWDVTLQFLEAAFSGGYPAHRVRWRWLPSGVREDRP